MITTTITNKKRIIKVLEENYIWLNITMLLLATYVIFFPIISIPIKQIIPSFGQCPYLKMTGNPCPLCGGTRYIENIGQVFNDITYLFHPFGIMVIVILLEIIFRTCNLIMRNKYKNIVRIVKIDIVIHVLISIAFIAYEILFFIF